MLRVGDVQQSDTAMVDAAIWLTCPDCGHTTRVLALLAGRVLKDRTRCLECSSTVAPHMNFAPTGRGIALSDEQNATLRELDVPALHAWVADRERQTLTHRVHAAGSRLADRFARGRRASRTAAQGTQGDVRASAPHRAAAGFQRTAGTITDTGSAVHP